MMARRDKVLGNDPFKSGAATRAPSQTASKEPEAPALQAPSSTQEESPPGPSAIDPGSPPEARNDRDPAPGDWGDTLERLSASLRATGAGVAALEMGEEVLRTVGLFERSLRSVVGPSFTAEVQEAVADLAEVGRRVVHSARRTPDRSPPPTEFDPFGRDPDLAERIAPALEVLTRRYFRVEIDGLENIPDSGRCLLVCNHSGAVPWDALVLSTAIRLEHPSPRPLRPLLEDFVFHFPFVGVFLNRFGGVRACPENAERLLRSEALLGVFPEGLRGLGKLYRDRHQLERFGRGGFVKLALRTNTPLVPVALVGPDETHPILCKTTAIARLVGLPFVPVTPTFPLLGPLGLLPLPSKWRIRIGKPLDLDGATAQDAKSRITVNRLAEGVRDRIQVMLDDLRETRGHPFL